MRSIWTTGTLRIPPRKLKLGLQNRCEKLVIANHLDESLWLGNHRNREQYSDHIYYTLLWHGHSLYQPKQTVQRRGGWGVLCEWKDGPKWEQYLSCFDLGWPFFDFNLGEHYVRRCWGVSVNQRMYQSKWRCVMMMLFLAIM